MRGTLPYAAVTNDEHNAADGRFSTACCYKEALNAAVLILKKIHVSVGLCRKSNVSDRLFERQLTAREPIHGKNSFDR